MMRIAVPEAISPAALVGHDPAAQIVSLGGATMGTTWSARLAAPAALDVPAVQCAIEARLDQIVAEMSHWAADSLLCGFNRSAGQWISLPPDFAAVITAALTIAEWTDGAFDPTIGRLVTMWGFGPSPIAEPPQETAILAARAAAGWQRLAYDAEGARLRQPGGLALDLSGIAKGYAADALADLLRDSGVRHCLVEIGGELVGRGIRPDGDPWWVELETPPQMMLPPFRIALHQLAVATSGNYRRGNHTLDPRTGRPMANPLLSVSVLHESAMLADAWATALTVLGPVDGPARAENAGLAARFVEQDGERLTSGLAAMLA
jgi:thiamine biosynthesis lipoprotein